MKLDPFKPSTLNGWYTQVARKGLPAGKLETRNIAIMFSSRGAMKQEHQSCVTPAELWRVVTFGCCPSRHRDTRDKVPHAARGDNTPDIQHFDSQKNVAGVI
ncbi:unnamed protein product [Ectocarpus sp. 4 AP-2014]